jgi:hypothetical protein
MIRRDPVQLISTATRVLRSFNDHSQPDQPDGAIPAPDLYRITGSAAELSYLIPHGLRHIADALQRSSPVFNAYYPAGHSAENIAVARHALLKAAEAFQIAAQHLSQAQAALAPGQTTSSTSAETRQHNSLYRTTGPAAGTERLPAHR